VIGYFINSGDEAVSLMFTPYIWQEHGLATLFENTYSNKSYGPDLKLLLIMYYVEGKFDINGPWFPKVSNYSSKNKNINVAFTVKPEQFHNRNEFERREFVLDSTINAVKLVKDKLQKRNLDIKFDELISDINSVGKEYLSNGMVLS
jgi:hypothetical protein